MSQQVSDWVRLTLIWMFHSACPSALPSLPISHQPKQNWTDGGTAKIEVNPTQVRDLLGHPVLVVQTILLHVKGLKDHGTEISGRWFLSLCRSVMGATIAMNHPSPTQRNYFFLSKNGIVFTRNHFLMVANHRYRVARMHESLRLMAPKNLNIESIEEWKDGKNNHNFFRGIIFIFSSSSLSLCALSELLCKLSKIVPAQSSLSFLGASGQSISHLWRRGAS